MMPGLPWDGTRIGGMISFGDARVDRDTPGLLPKNTCLAAFWVTPIRCWPKLRKPVSVAGREFPMDKLCIG